MLAESLVAGGVIATPVALLTLVDGLMSTQPSGSKKTLIATRSGASVFPFSSMRTLDVLFEVLLLYIGLVAVGISTLEGSVIGM